MTSDQRPLKRVSDIESDGIKKAMFEWNDGTDKEEGENSHLLKDFRAS